MQITDHVSLSGIENSLSSLLTTCSSAEDTHPCLGQLVSSLKLLGSEDLLTFVERKLTGRDLDTSEAMILIDALSYLGLGSFGGVLSQLIRTSQSVVDEELALKILFHLTAGRLEADR